MTREGFATDVLVDAEWLAEHIHEENVVVAEVDEKPDLYDEGHIPGAVKLHWRFDLQDPVRRDLVDQSTFERLMSERGIGNDTTVVLYGDRHNWFAAFAYWYLKSYGHADVRILDGGRDKWIADGREITADVQPVEPTEYVAHPRNEEIRAYQPQVLEWLDDEQRVLVDVRSPAEFNGELIAPEGYEQEGAQRAGHIPGAVSIPWSSAVNDDSTFRDADELRELYSGKGVTPDRSVVAYCRIGERSAHTWFVLHELLGFEDVRNYDGSWTEWGNLVGVPIELETDTPALAAANC
jgi:thiosulfate/3-mercaptopyruvate sulfurtransferase